MITLYHSSPCPIIQIKPYGSQTGAVDFGGVFALTDPEGSIDHGSFLHRIELDNSEVLNQWVIDNQLSRNLIEQVLRRQLRIESEDDLTLASRITVDDQSVFDLSEVDRDRLCYLFRSESDCLAWEGQRVRGQIALAAGYKAVEMTDEHGRSYLVLPGTDITLMDKLEKEAITPLPESLAFSVVPSNGRRERRYEAHTVSASASYLASLEVLTGRAWGQQAK